MFHTQSRTAVDPLFNAIAMCATDTRPSKIDLLLGVYKDESGETPVMAAVTLAEAHVATAQKTKNYLALGGREAFTSAVTDMVLGKGALRQRALGIQAVGGTGALKLLFELIKRTSPAATLWLSEPGYSGHAAGARDTGLAVRRYRYATDDAGRLDQDEMFDSLATARTGDFVVIDASCHNPTGVDMSAAGWVEFGGLCQRLGLIPFVDVAYQGLGTSLESDVANLCRLAETVDYMMISVSCSKTFGIYRERAGAAILVGPTQHQVADGVRALTEIGFTSYGVPPDHGAAVIATILNDPSMRALWEHELADMRERLTRLRWRLSSALSGVVSGGAAHCIKTGQGMFSLLPLTADQMKALRESFAIHGFGNGRINVTCMNSDQIQMVGSAIRQVIAT
jgi:aspartate aminotransferase